MIEQIINDISSKSGIDAAKTQVGLSTIVGLLKEKLYADQFSALTSQVSGLETLIGSGSQTASGIGGLKNMVGGLFGGTPGGDAAELLGKLALSGFSFEEAKPFLSATLDQLKANVTPELLAQITNKVPAIKPFLDDGNGGSDNSGSGLAGLASKFF
jgi:hypothetical protein